MSNNLKNISTEELLKYAEESSGSEIKTKKHVLDFINEYNIVPGLIEVPNHVIYYQYRRVWRPETRTKLSKIEFFRNFSKHFDLKRKTKTRYYLLNDGSFDLSELSLKQSKDSDKAYENKVKKKNKKKSSKIPELKKGIHVD